MKFQKELTAKFAAAALAVGLAQATPVFAQESPAPETQPDTQLSIQMNPLVPVELLGGLGGMAALLMLMGLKQRTRSSVLRAGASAAFVAALANPTILHDELASLPTQIALVIDKSASQSVNGRDTATAQMQAALAKQLSRMEGVKVRTIEINGRENNQATDGTNLFHTMQKNLADISPGQLGAVIVLTDGQTHDTVETLTAVSPETPVHVFISGREDEHDRRIVLESAPAYGIVKENVTVRFHVIDDGEPAEQTNSILVTLTTDGENMTSKYVTPGESVEMSARISHGGANILEIKTDPVSGELTDINNRIITSVQGVREDLNILMISGEPGNGTRMWRNLLTADPSVNLVHFTVLRPPAKDDDTPLKELALISMPARELFEEKLDEFDLVIFDRYTYRGILPPHYLQKIAGYIEKGGAMLVTAGPEMANMQGLNITALAQSLPINSIQGLIEKPFQPKVNDLGQRHLRNRAPITMRCRTAM
jgi:hypothetical protein